MEPHPTATQAVVLAQSLTISGATAAQLNTPAKKAELAAHGDEQAAEHRVPIEVANLAEAEDASGAPEPLTWPRRVQPPPRRERQHEEKVAAVEVLLASGAVARRVVRCEL